jgi:hypothetical protein
MAQMDDGPYPKKFTMLTLDDLMKPLATAYYDGSSLHNRILHNRTIPSIPSSPSSYFEQHDARFANRSLEHRNYVLPDFLKLEQIIKELADHTNRYRYIIPREISVRMIGVLLGAMNLKGDNKSQVLAAMVSLLESDKPGFPFTPLSLYLAIKRLLQKQVFELKPAEFLEACRIESSRVGCCREYCNRIVDYICHCDAVVLQFDTEQWYAPYKRQPRALVQRMLDLHERWGCNSEEHEADFLNLVADAKKGLGLLPPRTELIRAEQQIKYEENGH